VAFTTLWFDIGYTLLYKPREKAYQAVLAELGHSVTVERLEREYHLVDKLFMRERPGVFGHDPATFMPWFLGELNYRLGIRTDIARTWDRLKAVQPPCDGKWIPFDCVPAALAALKAKGYRLGVISNWDASARSLLAACCLDTSFDPIVISCEVGVEKPDPRIYRFAMEKAGVTPAECLYVGDNYYVDAIGAERAGMEPVIINRFGSLGVEEIQGQAILGDISELAGWLDARQQRG
jgi:putative hydrolase of the HAD superfamily